MNHDGLSTDDTDEEISEIQETNGSSAANGSSTTNTSSAGGRISKTRPFRNIIHRWFEGIDGKKIKCKLCSASIAYQYGPTNLENHLKTHKKTHKEEYEKYLLEKATAAASASARGKSSGKTKKVAVLGNKTIESSFQEQRERNDGIKKNSEKYNVNVRSIGVALAGNSLAHMLIEDRLFRNMLKTVSDGRSIHTSYHSASRTGV